jgi:hypothetical protein
LVGGLKRTWVVVLAIAASLLIAEALPAIADSGDSAHAVAAKKKCKKKKAGAAKKKKCRKKKAPATPPATTPTPTSAALSISPGSQGFGSNEIGVESTKVFTVTNSGGVPTGTLLNQITGPDPDAFGVSSTTCGATIAAASSCTLTIGFTPDQDGAASATLTVSGSPGGSASATLTGSGFSALTISDPPDYDFGTVSGPGQASHVFTITNTGPAAISSLFITTIDTTTFAISNTDTCDDGLTASGTMGDTCTVTITFNPTGPNNTGFGDALMVTGSPGGSVERQLSGFLMSGP